MRAALLQLNSGDNPAWNLPVTLGMVDEAVARGARFVLTPEVTNCVSANRAQQREVLQDEGEDITLSALRECARRHEIWIVVGSLALKPDNSDDRFINRSFLIAPDGAIKARYDKIHMFDVSVSEVETYRESDGYQPGSRAVIAQMPQGLLGMTICYDVRFPHLYRHLAKCGAQFITVPSAFSPITGAAHWEVLLRARAIETGAYILAPAQTGYHTATQGRARETFGHSLVVGPWGDVLADGGEEPGIVIVDLDPNKVAQARKSIPAMTQDTEFGEP